MRECKPGAFGNAITGGVGSASEGDIAVCGQPNWGRGKMQLVKFLVVAGFALALPAWTQTIKTVAGAGSGVAYTEGAAATSVRLGSPLFVKADSAGNFYIWDGAAAIRKVTSAGTITTYAGNGLAGYSGDGSGATSAMIFGNGTVQGLAVDNSGNVYFSDGQNRSEEHTSELQSRQYLV